jgi:molecular chaperone GrpE
VKDVAEEGTHGQEREKEQAEGVVAAEQAEFSAAQLSATESSAAKPLAEEAAQDAGAVIAPEVEEKEQVDELAALRQELEQTKAKEAEYLDGWQRARAELSNARKRFQREQEQTYANAKVDILRRLLPIVDDFERAFDKLPGNPSAAEANNAGVADVDQPGLSWVAGVKLIQRSFLSLLEQEGVAPIVTDGQRFDPCLHQAVTHEPSAEVPEGFIIGEMRKGYKLGDHVLQPSMVRVSSGPPVEPEPETEVEPAVEEEAADTEQS